MVSNQLNPPLPRGKTNSVHIGYDRFAVVTQLAIEVSYDTGIQITPSQFVQHLIERYGLYARQHWASNHLDPLEQLKSAE